MSANADYYWDRRDECFRHGETDARIEGNPPNPDKSDLHVSNQGSVFLLSGITPAGLDWLDAHIPADAMTFGPAIVVEHRFIGDIVQGAQADGLTVS